MTSSLRSLLKNPETTSGLLLMALAIVALILANSPFERFYNLLLDTPVEVRVGALQIDKPLLLWINDGLMAIFFFLVGLELKQEVIAGELSDPKKVVLPGVGALGGMLVPALVYTAFNYDNPTAMQGWAIPAATDIAFALGILSLLGPKVPVSIKVFLTSLAIFDDIGAIIIIALFYTSKISTTALIIVAFCLPILYWLNHKNVESKSVYMIIGVIMWTAMLKSGVHATLTGVLLAMFIPMESKTGGESPLKSLEHDLKPAVNYFVLPVFAFANAGINILGIDSSYFLHPVPMGIALGLFVGKQVGIFSICWLAVKAGIAKLPKGMSWSSLYGTTALCGVGFTMSLFIGSLAFEESEINNVFDERVGILMGSFFSGLVGFFLLRWSLNRKRD